MKRWFVGIVAACCPAAVGQPFTLVAREGVDGYAGGTFRVVAGPSGSTIFDGVSESSNSYLWLKPLGGDLAAIAEASAFDDFTLTADDRVTYSVAGGSTRQLYQYAPGPPAGTASLGPIETNPSANFGVNLGGQVVFGPPGANPAVADSLARYTTPNIEPLATAGLQNFGGRTDGYSAKRIVLADGTAVAYAEATDGTPAIYELRPGGFTTRTTDVTLGTAVYRPAAVLGAAGQTRTLVLMTPATSTTADGAVVLQTGSAAEPFRSIGTFARTDPSFGNRVAGVMTPGGVAAVTLSDVAGGRIAYDAGGATAYLTAASVTAPDGFTLVAVGRDAGGNAVAPAVNDNGWMVYRGVFDTGEIDDSPLDDVDAVLAYDASAGQAFTLAYVGMSVTLDGQLVRIDSIAGDAQNPLAADTFRDILGDDDRVALSVYVTPLDDTEAPFAAVLSVSLNEVPEPAATLAAVTGLFLGGRRLGRRRAATVGMA